MIISTYKIQLVFYLLTQYIVVCIKRVLGVILIQCFMAGCCTKKGCDCSSLKIPVKIDSLYKTVTVIVTERDDYSKILDSTNSCISTSSSQYGLATFYLSNEMFNKANLGLNRYSYIIKNNFHRIADTINTIDFEEYSYSFVCNYCPLTGDDIKACTGYKNLFIIFNSQKVSEIIIK